MLMEKNSTVITFESCYCFGTSQSECYHKSRKFFEHLGLQGKWTRRPCAQRKNGFFELMVLLCRIESKCSAMMFSDPSYYLENGIDSILWKDRFYRPIEIERSSLSKKTSSSSHDIKPLLALISEGIEYYTQLIKKLKNSSTVERAI